MRRHSGNDNSETAPSDAVSFCLTQEELNRAIAFHATETGERRIEAMHIEGQCHCGLVRFEADIDPQAVSICHCTDCQSLTGSPYRVTVLCSGDQIRMTAGVPRIYAKTGDNGRRRFQHFCPDCGSPLFTSGEGEQSDSWGIRWGSIRQRDRLRPVRQIWCCSAAPWVNTIADLPRRLMD